MNTLPKIHTEAPIPPVAAGPRSRIERTAAFLILGILTAHGVFILPFRFPPSHAVLSGAYTAGFNNRISVLAAAAACALTFLWAWYRDFPRKYSRCLQHERIPGSIVIACLLVCGMFTAYLGWTMTRAGVAYNDNLYFLEFMHARIDFHLRIYRDFSFLYGPLLLEWPVAVALALRPLHVGIQGSYYVALTLFEVGGLLLLWVTLQRLPLSRNPRIAVFCFFTLATLCPLLGLNYSLIRSLLPFSTLLFLSKIRAPLAAAGALLLGEALQLLVSPELGVAFAAGACLYALCMAIKEGRLWLLALLSPVLGAVAFIGIVGRQYLDSIGAFSKGCLNLVVQPLPYILLFLAAVVWLNPRMIAALLRERRNDAILMASLSVTSLAMLPAALGRCDPLHVFFNGVGMFLLGSVAISGYGRNARQAWWMMLFLSVVWIQLVVLTQFPGYLIKAARIAHAGPAARETIDAGKLASLVGDQPVAVPFTIPYSVEQQLINTHHYHPDPECFYIRVWDAETESAKAARMNQYRWALIPDSDMTITEGSRLSASIVGFGFHYPDRRQPWTYGAILYADLHNHWMPVAKFGNLTLYQQRTAMR